MCCGDSKDNKSSTGGGGGCCGGGAQKGEKMEKWRQKQKELHDYKFSDVDVSKFRVTKLANIRKYITMLMASTNYFLFIALDVQVSYWLFQADPNEFPQAVACGAAYAAVSGLNIAWTFYNIYRAYQIYQSNDISDAFIHPETYRFRTIISYDVFCFFNLVTAKRSCKEKIVLWVYDSIRQLPQIVFVKAPQLAIMMFANDALKVFANKDNGIPPSQASADMKFSLLVAEIWSRFFAVTFMYMWVKCCMGQDSLPEYANYLVESRINTLVKNGGASLAPEEDEDQKGKGCCV